MKKNNETHTRKIINEFISAKAFNKKNAISMTNINVDFKESEKTFLINSLLNSGYIMKSNDEKMWFNQNEWNKSIRKLTFQYSLIMFIPIVIAVILYILFF